MNGRGGERKRGWEEMPLQATVCKILAKMKAGSPVDHFLSFKCDHSSKRKKTSPNIYAQTPFPKPCAKTYSIYGRQSEILDPIKHILYDIEI